MFKNNSILLTLIQIAIGVVITLVGCLLYLLVFKLVFWSVIINDRISHGFWVGLLLILSIAATYGVIVVGVTEGIRFVGRVFGINIPFKPVCSGAFLGAPAVVGLLSLLNVPWDIFGSPNVILTIILPLFKTLAYLLSLPIRAWIRLNFPVEILYVVAIPIGAILGYRLSKLDDIETDAHQT